MPRKKCYSRLNSEAWDPIKQKKWMRGVLMTNWYEDEVQSCKGAKPPFARVTEYKCEFTPHDAVPDLMVKYQNRLKASERIPKELVLGHYDRLGNQKYLITSYDEHVNGRKRPCDQLLPCLRVRNCSRNAWLPEKSDYPLLGPPTNWGLMATKRRDLLDEIKSVTNFSKTLVSTYQDSYSRPRCPVPADSN